MTTLAKALSPPPSQLPAHCLPTAAHELGHRLAAGQRGIQLAPPLFIPAGLGLLGSFGAITRIKSFVPDRASLAAVAAAGPLAGSAVAAAVMLAGAALTAAGAGGVEVSVDSFRCALPADLGAYCMHAAVHLRCASSFGYAFMHLLSSPAVAPCALLNQQSRTHPHPAHLPCPTRRESLLAGALGQAAFGGDLFASDAASVSPLFVAGWAGLIVNALNCLPAGELDGGRIYLGLCGRRAAARLGAGELLSRQVGGVAAGRARVVSTSYRWVCWWG